ncbi:MAG: tRNA (cytidine(56)-2'-O)-methyltransferase [archaeon]|nr:tRNA (cytidine(56)-2'-O)-methyltransferase [archaeon]
MGVTVLRLGHRHYRDQRLTTHVALTARALGAEKVILSGEKDEKIIGSVKDIARRWGGDFEVEYEKNYRRIINNFHGVKVHLTMYGLRVQDKMKDIRGEKDVLVVLGSEKVPRDVYHMVDYNIAVGSQPHSEVAALAVFLHEYFGGKELEKVFRGAKIRVVPQERGKKRI